MSQTLTPPVHQQENTPHSQIIELLKRGDQLDAIVLYRSQHGGSVFEAKQAVDAIATEHGIKLAAANPAAGKAMVYAGFAFVALLIGVMSVTVAMVVLT